MPRPTASALRRGAKDPLHHVDDGSVHAAGAQRGGRDLRQLGGDGGQEGVAIDRLQLPSGEMDGGEIGVGKRCHGGGAGGAWGR